MFSSDHATRHIQRFCRERKALYVNEWHGPTLSMRGESSVAKTNGMYSEASTVHTRVLRRFVTVPKVTIPTHTVPPQTVPQQTVPQQTVPKQTDSKQPNQTQPDKQKPDAKQLEPTKASSAQPSSTREKLIPLSGSIRAKDSQGWQYRLSFKHIEMEIDWPVTGCQCKVTGTANVDSW